MKNGSNIRGVIPPAVTPFDAHGEIDFALFRDHLRFLLNAGVHGIGVAGSTGEGPSLDPDELASLVSMANDTAAGEVPVIAGIMAESTREAVRLARIAVDTGADALLVTPVRYSGATHEENLGYFRAITEAVQVPLIIYNVVPTNLIDVDTAVALVGFDRVVGIKQVDAAALGLMVSAFGETGHVYSACDSLLYSTYTAGAIGCIAAIATVCPELCVKQWNAYLAGEHKVATDIQFQLAPVVRSYMNRPFPAKVKYAMKCRGLEVGYARAPLHEPGEQEKKMIADAVQGIPLEGVENSSLTDS